MGTLLLWSNISIYIALFITAISSSDSLGNRLIGMLIALAINIVTIIRLFLEKRKFKNVAFTTSQLVYIVSTFAATFGCLFLTLLSKEAEWGMSIFMLIVMMGGLFVMMFTAPFIGIAYLSLYNQKGEYAGKEHIFMPSGENRNIRKPLRALCAGIGATLILVAVIVFLVGAVDSLGSGELSSMTCNRCSGSGRWSGEKCPTCDGFGQILHNENGRNIMGTPALWIGIIGIGLIVVGSLLKDDSYHANVSYVGNTYTKQQSNNDKLAPSIAPISAKIDGNKWICGHCGTSNSLNYGQCKKCGKYKS